MHSSRIARGGVTWKSVIFIDAPVLDIRSWPGGKYAGRGNPDPRRKYLQAYGYASEEDAQSYTFREKSKTLLKNKIPLMIVAGNSDPVVPFDENAALLIDFYAKNDGTIKAILKTGVGHHPHNLKDP